ncbi:MAG TPA: response regulator transcription factor, partial [Ktedonobacteraceae bacterium]|nr:response regulator transcription factor [Ktedonobacteraceae bacterium]
LAHHLNPLSAGIYPVQAFFLLRFEKRTEAETFLSDLIGWTKQAELHGMLILLLALQAILVQAEGESTRAETALKEALVLAEALGYARTLLDLDEAMQALLFRLWSQRSVGDQSSSTRYLDSLLAACQGRVARDSSPEPICTPSLIEPLSLREQEVLYEIIEGYSNQEIARHLVISLSTVKSHINSIYRKLQTKSRTQAIARSRALNLFPR